MTRDEIQSLDALNNERLALHHMRTSEGWKLFTAEMEKSSIYAYQQMASTENPTVLAKQTGAWHVAQSAIRYPDVRLAQIEVLIRAAEERAAKGR